MLPKWVELNLRISSVTSIKFALRPSMYTNSSRRSDLRPTTHPSFAILIITSLTFSGDLYKLT